MSAVCYRGSPEGAFPGLAAQDVSRAPVGLAVAACIAAGRTEPGGVEEQYQVLDGATELLVAAPDDEVVGELLMLQVGLGGRGWGGGGAGGLAQPCASSSTERPGRRNTSGPFTLSLPQAELLQQQVINRARVAGLLDRVLQDAPVQVSTRMAAEHGC